MVYDREWWAKQEYVDTLPRIVRLKRLAWIVAWGIFAKWMPYFMCNCWRVLLLSFFGLRHRGSVSVYPSASIWAPWNVETGSFVAIDDNVNLYSVDKIVIVI